VIPYTVPVNPEFLPQEVRIPLSSLGGQAGDAVAVAGSLIGIGAPFASPGGVTYAGEAYVLNTSSGASYMLYSPAPVYPGQFGSAIAIGGGYVFVGAPGESDPLNPNDTGAGAVYVFSASTGGLVTTLVSPNARFQGFFGFSVAVSGNTLVVGGPNETLAGINSGLAYVFLLHTWTSLTLTSPSPVSGGMFGDAVAVSGADVVVGAPNEGVSEAGNAYVYSSSTGDLLWTLPHTGGCSFGFSVAMGGPTIVVGAPFTTDGNVTMFTFGSNVSVSLPTPHLVSGGEFGSAVAISGDTVVVGAAFQDPDGLAEAGEAYTFSTVSGPFLLGQYIADPPQEDWADGYGLGSLFGYSVAIGSAGILVGAPGENATGLTNTGVGFLFRDLPLRASDPTPGSKRGWAFLWASATES